MQIQAECLNLQKHVLGDTLWDVSALCPFELVAALLEMDKNQDAIGEVKELVSAKKVCIMDVSCLQSSSS